MKKSTISTIMHTAMEEIYSHRDKNRNSARYKKSEAVFAELKEKINDQSLLKLIESYLDITTECLSDDTTFFFAEGFKLGLLLGFECLL